MQVHTRRAMLAAGATLVAGTVAAATLLRKPAHPPILTPVDAPAPHLLGAEALKPRDGTPPADVTFLSDSGQEHRLSDFSGHGLVVNLWATWCMPCVAEMPALQTLAATLKPDGILVLPLSSDRGGLAVVKRFYDSHGITGLPIWLDPRGDAARAWGARGLPTTMVLDRTGHEKARLEGGAAWDSTALVAAVRGLVG